MPLQILKVFPRYKTLGCMDMGSALLVQDGCTMYLEPMQSWYSSKMERKVRIGTDDQENLYNVLSQQLEE